MEKILPFVIENFSENIKSVIKTPSSVVPLLSLLNHTDFEPFLDTIARNAVSGERMKKIEFNKYMEMISIEAPVMPSAINAPIILSKQDFKLPLSQEIDIRRMLHEKLMAENTESKSYFSWRESYTEAMCQPQLEAIFNNIDSSVFVLMISLYKQYLEFSDKMAIKMEHEIPFMNYSYISFFMSTLALMSTLGVTPRVFRLLFSFVRKLFGDSSQLELEEETDKQLLLRFKHLFSKKSTTKKSPKKSPKKSSTKKTVKKSSTKKSQTKLPKKSIKKSLTKKQ